MTDPTRRPAAPLELTETTFDEALAASDRPVLVDFWAPWCGPCRLLRPIVEQLGAEWADRLAVARVDIDQQPGLAARLAIYSIPTLVLFGGGQEIERLIGFRRRDELAARLGPHL